MSLFDEPPLHDFPDRAIRRLLEHPYNLRDSQAQVAHREEVAKMSETVERTWEQELLARGEARGQVEAFRENLRVLLEERFGALPEALVQRIQALDDLERLRRLLRQALHLTALAELEL